MLIGLLAVEDPTTLNSCCVERRRCRDLHQRGFEPHRLRKRKGQAARKRPPLDTAEMLASVPTAAGFLLVFLMLATVTFKQGLDLLRCFAEHRGSDIIADGSLPNDDEEPVGNELVRIRAHPIWLVTIQRHSRSRPLSDRVRAQACFWWVLVARRSHMPSWRGEPRRHPLPQTTRISRCFWPYCRWPQSASQAGHCGFPDVLTDVEQKPN